MKKRMAVCLICCVVTGCGGGSSGSPASTSASPASTPTNTPVTFPVGIALTNLNSKGFSASFNITGKLNNQAASGSGSISRSPDSAATFEGQQALVSTVTVTATLNGPNGSVPFGDSAQGYTDTDYNPIGVVSGLEYDDLQGTSSHPVTVKVGDTGFIGAMKRYIDSSKAVLLGTTRQSYVIESDTANTAILDIITNQYDTSNTEMIGSQTRYRIDQNGTITWLSLTYTYLAGSVTGTITLTSK